jgi:RNA polymerase sigma-70 factor (ECF subfamily)
MNETVIGNLQLDSSFLKRIQKGDEGAVLALYEACFSPLMNVAIRYKNNREDQISLINNAFLKAVKHIADFQLGTSFISWIKVILKNEITDDFRRNKRHYSTIQLIEQQELTEDTRFDENYDIKVEKIKVTEVLSKLPPATRTVFNLFLWEDLRPSEIAEELTISIETVRWHIKTARKLIRQQYEKS